MNGKLIVIEGIDSSGKTTQLNLLKEYFEKQTVAFKVFDFPQYETSFYGKMIARFLRGEFGPLGHVDPHLISVIYAQDRGLAKEQMKKWLSQGKYILSNRYATSNMAHQAGRVSEKDRNTFVLWLEELEYKIIEIPREDIVLFLDMPYAIAQSLMQNENRIQKYRQGVTRDMVEKDVQYLHHASQTYQWLSQKFPHWVRIDCVDALGKLKSREEIHEGIKKILAKKGIIK